MDLSWSLYFISYRFVSEEMMHVLVEFLTSSTQEDYKTWDIHSYYFFNNLYNTLPTDSGDLNILLLIDTYRMTLYFSLLTFNFYNYFPTIIFRVYYLAIFCYILLIYFLFSAIHIFMYFFSTKFDII